MHFTGKKEESKPVTKEDILKAEDDPSFVPENTDESPF
jgi:hypothetical protein